MNKDKFEIEIGEQLRKAEAPVPADAWSAIKASIVNVPAATISPVGPVVGVVVGAALLISLAIYSNSKEVITHTSDKVAVEEVQTKLPKESENKTATINELQDSKPVQQEIQPAGANVRTSNITVLSNPVSANKVAEQENRETTIEFQPIAKNQVSEIDSHRVQTQQQRNLAKLPETKVENHATDANVTPVKARISASQINGYAPLRVQFHNNGSGQRYYWEFGSVAESTDENPEVVFEEPGVYTVNLSASNSKGDVSQDFIQITVKEGSSFYIPNSFSPNGDGLNDTYEVGSARNIKSFFMIIIDEKGKTVFQTQNVNEAWNYDQALHGRSDSQYFVSYKAVGVDGKIYSERRKPINIVF